MNNVDIPSHHDGAAGVLARGIFIAISALDCRFGAAARLIAPFGTVGAALFAAEVGELALIFQGAEDVGAVARVGVCAAEGGKVCWIEGQLCSMIWAGIGSGLTYAVRKLEGRALAISCP